MKILVVPPRYWKVTAEVSGSIRWRFLSASFRGPFSGDLLQQILALEYFQNQVNRRLDWTMVHGSRFAGL